MDMKDQIKNQIKVSTPKGRHHRFASIDSAASFASMLVPTADPEFEQDETLGLKMSSSASNPRNPLDALDDFAFDPNEMKTDTPSKPLNRTESEEVIDSDDAKSPDLTVLQVAIDTDAVPRRNSMEGDDPTDQLAAIA